MKIPFVVLKEASAGTLTLTQPGNNLMDGHWAETDNWWRRVVRVGAVGSDADGELTLVVYYGERRVCQFTNFDTVEGITSFDLVPINSRLTCRPGENIAVRLEGSNQSATNPIYVAMDIKDIRKA